MNSSLRTNDRKDEEAYIYRTSVPAPIARKLFMTSIGYLKRLQTRQEWYNAVTRNCTTTIEKAISEDLPDAKPWTYRLLLNGSLDQLM